MSARPKKTNDFLSIPWLGETFSWLGILAFFFLCMLLPLVGKAGSRTDHYWPQNYLTFLGVLLAAIACSALGHLSKTRRRADGDAAYPWRSAAITLFYVLWLVVFLAGGLKI